MAWFTQVLFGRLFEYLGYLCYHLKFEGLEYLRECDVPVIFVCNHKSWIDHFIIIAGALRRKGMVPIHVLVADDIWARPAVGTVCKALGAYPAQYGKGLEVSLGPLMGLLARGRCVGLYPEGKIAKNSNEFGRPRPGAAWLALKTERQILPMAIRGLDHFTWRSLFFGGRRVTIRFGKPFRVSGNPNQPEDIAIATATIMNAITRIYQEVPVPDQAYAAQ